MKKTKLRAEIIDDVESENNQVYGRCEMFSFDKMIILLNKKIPELHVEFLNQGSCEHVNFSDDNKNNMFEMWDFTECVYIRFKNLDYKSIVIDTFEGQREVKLMSDDKVIRISKF